MKLGKVQTFIFLIVQCPRLSDSENRHCSWSIQTMRKVNACPVTKYEVERAAENKDCNELALKQNCTSAENFKYHCLMNELEDGFVEVCAPAYFIHGFCAEYNIQAALIQDHFNIKCKDVKPPCAERYKSSDAYLYKGCYNLILENNNLSTMESTTHKHNTSISFMINDISAESTSDWKIAVGVTTATVLVLVIILGLVFHKKIKGYCKGENETEQQDPESKKNLIGKYFCAEKENAEIFASNSATDKLVQAIARGESLREVVKRDAFAAFESSEKNKVETEKYMKAYRTISSYFVKTRLYEQCQRTLEQKGVAILTGLPGCGKTLTAIQIMQTSYYKDWVKRKFTSWEHFLLLEANENTLVYIDNIFDGIMYRHELQRWWDSLCYYYQTYIKSQHVKVHLLITVKDHVIDKIREYMKMEIPVFEEACIIRAISLPFMDDEKRKILDSQIKYAKNSRNILPPLIDEEFFSQVKQVNGPIGFPLCAHLFAFEERPCKKDITVFEFPIRYIINQIADEIEKDNTNGVKTLWLLLLFSYPRTDIQDQRQKLDLKYGQTCREYLEKRGSKVLLEKLEPLEFANLIEIAEDFKERMLVEHSGSCYQLKHQIYVDGVVGYFCVEKSEIAVKFFPLDLLREQDFIGVQSECRAKLIERFKKEIKDKHLSEVFACKIFRQHDFENQFSRELEKEGIADWISFSDESSTYHLPTLFWTSKYRLNRLSRMVMELIERKGENVDSHFYFARFGECCAYSENYIQNTSFEIDHIKKSVWNFKSEEGFTIFHITLLLERSDYYAYLILKKLFNDIETAIDQSLKDSLLKTVLYQRSCSRILCLLELMSRKITYADLKKSPISTVVNDLDLNEHNEYFELECLVRICLLLIGGIDKLPQDSSDIRWRCGKYTQIKNFLCSSSAKQTTMVKCIKKCLYTKTADVSEIDEISFPPFPKNLCSDMKTTVIKSIHILANMETFGKF